MAAWRQRRLGTAAEGLDWSRCFASVLLVDSPSTPGYVRARLVQRFLDAAAEWNGLGKVVEVFACAPAAQEAEQEAYEDVHALYPSSGGSCSSQAAAEFASNVGLGGEWLGQILRKLGAGWAADLQQELLSEHDLIVALDRTARDAAAAEMRAQGLDPGAGNLMLLSDFIWHYEEHWDAIQAATCCDGSGTGFLDEGMERSLGRCEFESVSAAELTGGDAANVGGACSASGGMASTWDVPSWPRCDAGDSDVTGGAQGSPGDWRRLHCSLLKVVW